MKPRYSIFTSNVNDYLLADSIRSSTFESITTVPLALPEKWGSGRAECKPEQKRNRYELGSLFSWSLVPCIPNLMTIIDSILRSSQLDYTFFSPIFYLFSSPSRLSLFQVKLKFPNVFYFLRLRHCFIRCCVYLNACEKHARWFRRHGAIIRLFVRAHTQTLTRTHTQTLTQTCTLARTYIVRYQI